MRRRRTCARCRPRAHAAARVRTLPPACARCRPRAHAAARVHTLPHRARTHARLIALVHMALAWGRALWRGDRPSRARAGCSCRRPRRRPCG
eukprot:6212556-Pleurochrysis_carterae.AAC.2